MKSLHDEIMNLKIDDEFSPARVNGFSIARRMSAELANEHDVLMGELLEALENIVNSIATYEWEKSTTGKQILYTDAIKAIAKAKGEVK